VVSRDDSQFYRHNHKPLKPAPPTPASRLYAAPRRAQCPYRYEQHQESDSIVRLRLRTRALVRCHHKRREVKIRGLVPTASRERLLIEHSYIKRRFLRSGCLPRSRDHSLHADRDQMRTLAQPYRQQTCSICRTSLATRKRGLSLALYPAKSASFPMTRI